MGTARRSPAGAAEVKPAEVTATIGQFRATARLNVRAVPGRDAQPLGKVEVGSLMVVFAIWAVAASTDIMTFVGG